MASSSSAHRVVVTGLGALTPIGNTVAEYWDGLLSGTSGAGPITKFDASDVRCKIACEVEDFDPSPYLDSKQVRRQDLFSQYALAVTQQAFEDAGLDPDTLDDETRDRTGVVMGTGVGGSNIFVDEVLNLEENGARRISLRASSHVSSCTGPGSTRSRRQHIYRLRCGGATSPVCRQRPCMNRRP